MNAKAMFSVKHLLDLHESKDGQMGGCPSNAATAAVNEANLLMASAAELTGYDDIAELTGQSTTLCYDQDNPYSRWLQVDPLIYTGAYSGACLFIPGRRVLSKCFRK